MAFRVTTRTVLLAFVVISAIFCLGTIHYYTEIAYPAYSIELVVTDAATGAPIQGASALPVGGSGTEAAKSSVSDASGKIVLSGQTELQTQWALLLVTNVTHSIPDSFIIRADGYDDERLNVDSLLNISTSDRYSSVHCVALTIALAPNRQSD